MLRTALILLLMGSAPVRAQTSLKAYGTVTDHFGTPVPGATIAVTSVDISPGVRAGERAVVGTGQCAGARPVEARTKADADGRFHMVLELGSPVRTLTCLAVVATPPARSPLGPIYLAMDSLEAGAIAAAGDSVRMDIIVPESATGVAGLAPLPPPPAFSSPDQELLWLGKNIPGGFGGYWRAAGSADVTVYLMDFAAAGTAKRLLKEYFRQRPPAGGAVGDVMFMHAQRDVATLIAWRDRLRAAGAAAGVRAADLRLDWNRLQVTVRGAAGRARLLARLPAMGIPQNAVFVVAGR